MVELGNFKSALIIAAHPDDEILGVGGTMAKLAQMGTQCSVVFLTTGVTARFSNLNRVPKKALMKVKEDSKKATKIVGCKDQTYLDFPDNRLDSIAKMDIVHKLRRVSDRIKPEIVFTHHYGDYNWDHRVAHEATLMAFRATYNEHSPRMICCYEVASSTERSQQNLGFQFSPNVYIDVSETIALKKKAMAVYETEVMPYPHPRSIKAIEVFAMHRGSEVNLEFAEAFSLVRYIG